MTELIATEKDYVSDLECIIKGYLKMFEHAGDKIPADLRGKKKIIFGNIEQIYEFHCNDFLCELESSKDQPSLVGGVFTMKSDEFEMYATYCKNKPSSEALRLDYINLPFFKVRIFKNYLSVFLECLDFLSTNQKHYQDLGSVHHQYGISALVAQTSFCDGSSDNLTKRWLFSHAIQLACL